MAEAWKQFEQSVAALLSALDPSAKVSHDKQIPDLDTGSPRQRDVWIETSFGGHFPIRILVSCKRKTAKINQQDMDAFIGELRSSGAHKGVLYSYSGYTKTALAKAERVGISCCILYKESPPQIPELLAFTAFHLSEQLKLSIDPAPIAPGLRWKEIIELPSSLADGSVPAADALAKLFHADDDALRDRLFERPPPGRIVELLVQLPGDGQPARLILESSWLIHRAKIESWCVNGSYSITDKDFKGSFATPAVDTWSSDPGPGWELIDPQQAADIKNVASFIRCITDVATGLRGWALQNDQVIMRSA